MESVESWEIGGIVPELRGVGYSGQTSERFRDFGCNVGRGVTKAKTEVLIGR